MNLTEQNAKHKVTNPENENLNNIGLSLDNIDKSCSVNKYINRVEIEPPIKEKYQTAKEREITRKTLAIWLVRIFGVSVIGNIVLAAALAFYPKANTSLLEKVLPIIISPQVTLLGVALGFYYGQKDEQS